MGLLDKWFMFAVKQHQRRREHKINLTWFVNLFHMSYADYCMEAWIAWTLENKKNENRSS